MSHIFISYSHEDRKYVEKLEKKLLDEDFDVWIDHRIDYGSAWPKEIEKALNACDAFIVVMSQSAYESPWVQREVIHAENKGKPFFPLLLKDDAWFTLGNIQFVDVKDGSLPPEKYYHRLALVTERKLRDASVPTSSKEETQSKRKVQASSSLTEKIRNNSKMIYMLLGAFALAMAVIFGLPLLQNSVDGTLAPTINATPINATPIFSPTFEAIETWVRPDDGMVMSQIPEGEFEMGADGNNEDPIHTIFLDSYWIDQTEVTNAMYAFCVEDGECVAPAEEDFANWRFEDHPVSGVRWDEARAYCKWVGARLPTEAEWEKAARGTDGRTFPWGEGVNCNLANYQGCIEDAGTTVVGSYESGRSPYGLYDMAGSVWEWTADWYSESYYDERPVPNPPGPETGTLRVARGGGSWGADYIRTSARVGDDPSVLDGRAIGFRCALSERP